VSGQTGASATSLVEHVITARPRDLAGYPVRRVLPSIARRMLGPFVFFDHFGPSTFAAGEGFDVRPHPHIGLATVTYLFQGAIVHRDSTGSAETIRPGDVNWMVAGRGIAHSERTPDEIRETGGAVHGIQSWVALPLPDEEREPSFEHHPASTLSHVRLDGAELTILAGTAYGAGSPVTSLSPTLYVAAKLETGASLHVTEEHVDRAAYIVEGSITCEGTEYTMGSMVVFRRHARGKIESADGALVMVVGGAPLMGERHIWWNFVSSSKIRIEQAKEDWREGRFTKVVGDEEDFIPLPEE
jgi:redox-sensitive bicupin YhaK (pirin superfamily)